MNAGATTRAVLSLLLLLPAGCATDGGLLKTEPTGAGNGSPAAEPGPATPRPQNKPPIQVTTAQVGNKKVEITATETDLLCRQMVAPYEFSDNLGDLVSLAATLALKTTGDLVGGKIDAAGKGGKGGSGPKTADARKGLKHQLPLELRQAAVRMNWLPMSFEVMFGREELSHAELLSPEDRVGSKLYPLARSMLAEVLKGVTEPHAYQFEIFVSRERGENAMALPGGFIIIDKGLLENEALRNKAYFALAHEVSHVLERHQTRALQARIVDSVQLASTVPDMLKTIRQTRSEPMGVVRLLVGGKLLFEKHAESQELQADACGVRVLDQSYGGDNRRLVLTLQSFADSLERQGKGKSVVLGSKQASGVEQLDALVDLVRRPVDAHPSAEERIQNLRTMVAEVRQRPEATGAGNKAGQAQAQKPRPKNVQLPGTIKTN